MQGSDELGEVQARLRKDLEEASEIPSHRSINDAAKWADKIQSAVQGLVKANALAGNRPLSVQQSIEHFKLAAQTLAVVQTAAGSHLDSLISGEWAIVLACQELQRRWGSPKEPPA